MALELTIKERDGPARIQVVPKDIAFFGRRADNDVVLPFGFVSSRHGRIFRRSGVVFVEDMGSTNGTVVNGDALSPMTARSLRPLDRVEIEKITILARFIEPTSTTATEAAAPTYHERVATPGALARKPLAPLAPAGSLPRTAAPVTLWELQAGASPGSIARREEVAAGTSRLFPLSPGEALAAAPRRSPDEEADPYVTYELLFKGLGLLAMLGGFALLVVVFLA